MILEDLAERVRQHYLDQFRAFVRQQREECKDSVPELKILLNGESSLRSASGARS